VSELNEAEQLEQVKGWFKENGLWIVAGIVIGMGGLGGYKWYEQRRETQAETASERYDAMLEAFTRNDRTRGLTLVEEINREYAWTPYAALATLIAARVHVEANELDKAATSLKSVVDTAEDEEVKMIARLRLARVLSAQGKHDEALATLVIEDAGAFGPRLAETRGDVLLAKGDRDGALREYQAARVAAKDGVVDLDLLELKIRDLGGTPPPREEES
jgi:predicted negative regulator of RcsB-dependent stress response